VAAPERDAKYWKVLFPWLSSRDNMTQPFLFQNYKEKPSTESVTPPPDSNSANSANSSMRSHRELVERSSSYREHLDAVSFLFAHNARPNTYIPSFETHQKAIENYSPDIKFQEILDAEEQKRSAS
jgi:hypothetical protein